MKNLFLLTVLLALGSAGCGDKSASSTAVSATKPYPLDVCIVAGEKLGSMGDPVVMVHNGQEIKFCCKGCKPDFEKDPAKYLGKLAQK